MIFTKSHPGFHEFAPGPTPPGSVCCYRPLPKASLRTCTAGLFQARAFARRPLHLECPSSFLFIQQTQAVGHSLVRGAPPRPSKATASLRDPSAVWAALLVPDREPPNLCEDSCLVSHTSLTPAERMHGFTLKENGGHPAGRSLASSLPAPLGCHRGL